MCQLLVRQWLRVEEEAVEVVATVVGNGRKLQEMKKKKSVSVTLARYAL